MGNIVERIKWQTRELDNLHFTGKNSLNKTRKQMSFSGLTAARVVQLRTIFVAQSIQMLYDIEYWMKYMYSGAHDQKENYLGKWQLEYRLPEQTSHHDPSRNDRATATFKDDNKYFPWLEMEDYSPGDGEFKTKDWKSVLTFGQVGQLITESNAYKRLRGNVNKYILSFFAKEDKGKEALESAGPSGILGDFGVVSPSSWRTKD